MKKVIKLLILATLAIMVCVVMASCFGFRTHAHTPGETVIERETLTDCEIGGSYYLVKYCTECNKEISRERAVVSSGAHTPSEATRHNETPATCTEDGSYSLSIYCALCDKALEHQTVTIPKTNHADYTWITEKEATCTENGRRTKKCNSCGITIDTEIIDAAHTSALREENRIDPTCYEFGSVDKVTYCSVCNEELHRTNEVIPKTMHVGGTVFLQKEPTCDEAGFYCRECEVCNTAYDFEDIEELGHDYASGYCTRCGKTEGRAQLKTETILLNSSANITSMHFNYYEGFILYTSESQYFIGKDLSKYDEKFFEKYDVIILPYVSRNSSNSFVAYGINNGMIYEVYYQNAPTPPGTHGATVMSYGIEIIIIPKVEREGCTFIDFYKLGVMDTRFIIGENQDQDDDN